MTATCDSIHVFPSLFSIRSLDLHVKPGELLAVVGHVGAGKSSLIQAVLGEMDKLDGNVTICVSVEKRCSRLFKMLAIRTCTVYIVLKTIQRLYGNHFTLAIQFVQDIL